jgi:protein tyrosine phosphatase (PTP) superfamily phosphohydrolase (DUF442 family)
MKTEVPLVLYSSSRPGYELGRNPVPPQVVDEWIEDVKSQGVVSILCLLADDQLRLYAGLPTGLLAYYQAKGLAVGHVPAKDHASPPLSAAQLAEVEQAFSALPKPVLVHCSAGIDRTESVRWYRMSAQGGVCARPIYYGIFLPRGFSSRA